MKAQVDNGVVGPGGRHLVDTSEGLVQNYVLGIELLWVLLVSFVDPPTWSSGWYCEVSLMTCKLFVFWGHLF